MSGNISPDGKWKIIVQDDRVIWIELTNMIGQFTIKEIVEATKNIKPDIWKK